jgi:hypothetical protein
MLSPVEENALLRAQKQGGNEKTAHAQRNELLRLDGIIYNHQTSWTIWLNGRSVKPGQKLENLRIVKVTPYTVDLIWNPNPGTYHQVCLKPSESYHKSKDVH